MSKVRYMFLRDKYLQPIGCLAIQINEVSIYYGISVLNPLDKFDRKLARKIADGRLHSGALFEIIKNCNPISMHSISRAVMQDLYVNGYAPTRARKAAKLWLQNKGVSNE